MKSGTYTMNEAPTWGTSAPAETNSPEAVESFPTQTEAAHEAVEETPEAFIRRRDAEIQVWIEEKATLSAVKDREAEARAKLTSTCFPTPKKGTQRYLLNAGWALKLVFGWNFKLGDKDKTDEQGLTVPIREQVLGLEQAIIDLGPEGKLIVERLIDWKPELKAAEYERLSSSAATEIEVQAKALVDELLTVTPASPQLALEEPKKPK